MVLLLPLQVQLEQWQASRTGAGSSTSGASGPTGDPQQSTDGAGGSGCSAEPVDSSMPGPSAVDTGGVHPPDQLAATVGESSEVGTASELVGMASA